MRRFLLKTPKGLLTIVLGVLVAVAAPHEGIRSVGLSLMAAILVAALLDAVILRARRGRWQFPSGAILTAAIVAMVLSAQTPWYVVTATTVVAVVSKYIVRTRGANVFNPAALGIVALFPIFHAGESWWGALPEAPPLLQSALIAGGVFIAGRVNKLPLVIAFLGGYFLLFTASAFAGDPARVAELFRPPDLQAALYFAFFILTDPPTSPVRYQEQLFFAAIVAMTSFAVFQLTGAVYYLLAGVLCGNVWEAWRRSTLRTRRARRASSDPHEDASPVHP